MKSTVVDQMNTSTREMVVYMVNSNVFKRSLLGAIMLSLFIILCKNQKPYIVIFVICLTVGICYEIINLVRKKNKPLTIHPILVTCQTTLLYVMRVMPIFIKVYPILNTHLLIRSYVIWGFYGYAASLMAITMGLRKNKLSEQLILLVTIHITAYALGSACAYSVLNIARGQFYFFYPCILIISNDIFAYIIGKLFGKRPLYELSPNKTVEGFLGASVFTLLTGMLLCYAKLYWNFLPDETNEIISQSINPKVWYLNIPVLFAHNISFVLYASFVAPFIGFLASAIKRVFGKKDFGVVIPGHGGLTDRMDCQLLMVFFTHIYLNSFFRTKKESIESLVNKITGTYTIDEIGIIIENLLR